ncbi:uncharacterized protein FYW49_001760 [Xenentodon cancila]
MELLKDNISSHKYFILRGLDELGGLRPILSIPFFILFVVSLAANSLLLYVIFSQRSLHSPMCILIACMACVDLSLPVIFIPSVLLGVLLNWRGISLSGCLVQMYLLHFLGTCQSTLLLWMALDRYFAICTPLRYHDHMSLPRILKFVIPLLIRNMLMILAVVLLAGSLSFCFRNVINHCFCEHMALVELACGSTAINSLVGLMTVFFVPVLDFLVITASYIIIFRSVLQSGKSAAKALHTCVTHIIVMVISLTFVLTAFLSYRIRDGLPVAGRVVVSIVYLSLPSCFNPIIYGVRTTEIRQHILKMLSSCRLVSTMLDLLPLRNLSHSSFMFRGFPTLHQHRRLLALPFSISYLSVLLGNSLLVYVILSVERLHSPMYLLICVLCVVDVLVVTAILPNMLLGLLFDWNQISLAGCLVQMFFTHFLSSVESTLLLAMALDRYVAICEPLRYNDIMDSCMLLRLLLFTLVRSISIMATLVGLASSLWFCSSNTIQHCYCDHMALVSLACESTDKNKAVGLAVIICFVGVDIPVIFFSYMKILKAVLRAAAAGEDRLKAFHTCITHLMVLMCFYLVGSVTFLSHNLNIPIATDANTFLGVMYILFPATINPIIYGIRTKEIRKGLLKLFKVRSKK